MKTISIKTKVLTMLLTLCMVMSQVPLMAFAVDSIVSNETELDDAFGNADCAEIKLGGSIEFSWPLDVNRTVTLDLNGHTLTCSTTDMDMFRVSNGGNLTVKDSGTGGKIDGQNKNCGFSVKGGTLILNGGSIVNCTDADGDGGAVDVSITSVTEAGVLTKYGKFVMNGGTIKDCIAGDDGGAVDIGKGCTFIMNGGNISNCRANDDGGAVFIKQGAFFVMNSGTIENCSAANNGGAVNIYENGRFTMTGGTIKDCKVDMGGLGNAVYGKNNEAVVIMSGGTIENCGVFPWSFDEFTVTFDSDGGSAVATQMVLNSPAVKPADPKKDGYDFAGWYLGSEEYAFSFNVTENITLKAHWTPVATPNTINKAVVANAKFNYQPSNVPQKSASIFLTNDVNKYEIAYECWEEMKSGEPVAFWYSDESKYTSSMKRITQFEEGKTYMYSIELRAKDGYVFADNCPVMINNTMIDASNVIKTQNGLFIAPVKTITPIKPVTQKEIEVVEINNATLTFKDGDKPVFTGTTPDGAKYVMVYEAWKTDDAGISSDEFFNDDEHLPIWGGKLITAFDKDKIYTYMLYLKTTAESSENGWVFGPNTKLKVNGQEVTFTRDDSDDEYGQTFTVKTGLTMIPQESGTTPDYKVIEGANSTWTQNSNGTLTFRVNGDFAKFTGIKVDSNAIPVDKYIATSGSTIITLKNDYLGTLSIGKHTLTVVYSDGECSTEFEIKATQGGCNTTINKPEEGNTAPDKSNEGGIKAMQTGDNSNFMIWIALMFVSGGVLVGTLFASRRRR